MLPHIFRHIISRIPNISEIGPSIYAGSYIYTRTCIHIPTYIIVIFIITIIEFDRAETAHVALRVFKGLLW